MKTLLFYTLSSLLLIGCINTAPYKNKREIIDNMANTLQLKFPNVAVITAKDLSAKIEEKSFDYLLVDIRSEVHFKTSSIPGAVGVTQFLSAKNNFKDKLIILYSTIGLGANELATKLAEEGFNCVLLKGGTLAWAQENLDFMHENEPTKKLYIENEAWNILPENYKGVLP